MSPCLWYHARGVLTQPYPGSTMATASSHGTSPALNHGKHSKDPVGHVTATVHSAAEGKQAASHWARVCHHVKRVNYIEHVFVWVSSLLRNKKQYEKLWLRLCGGRCAELRGARPAELGTRPRGRDHMASPKLWPLTPPPQPSTGILRAAWTDRGKCFNAILCRFSNINRNTYKAKEAFLGMTHILHLEEKKSTFSVWKHGLE